MKIAHLRSLRPSGLVLTTTIAASLAVSSSEAQATFGWSVEAVLESADAETGDRFGERVALHGDTVVVGAPRDDWVAGTGAIGGAYVFVRSSSGWSEQAKFVASDGEHGDEFGYAVAVYEDTAIVGAWGNPPLGSAYVFVRNAGIWSEQAHLQPGLEGGGGGFGYSVAVHGDTAVIARPWEGSGGSMAGCVYVYVRSGSQWIQQQKIFRNEARASFGSALAMQEDVVLIGAPWAYHLGYSCGVAYLYTRSGGTWAERARLAPADYTRADLFGWRVGLDRSTAVIGAPLEDHCFNPCGAAYVFEEAASGWTQQAKITASNGDQDDSFGEVAIWGNAAIIGAYRADQSAPAAGAAYLYLRHGTIWSERGIIDSSPPVVGAEFGRAVSVRNGLAVIGSPFLGGSVPNSGVAYVISFDQAAVADSRTDVQGLNLLGLECEAPVVGTTWLATVNNALSGSAIAVVVGFAFPAEIYVPHLGGFLLLDLTSPGGELLMQPPQQGSGVVTFSAPVPLDASVVGFTLSIQGCGFGGSMPVALHNACDLQVGF